MVKTASANSFRVRKTFQQRLDENLALRTLYNFQEFVWIGLIFCGYLLLSKNQHNERMALNQQPLVNDFYFVDYYQIDPASDAKFRYLPLKITNIDRHNISFVASRVGHNKAASIKDQVKFDAPLNYNYFHAEETTISRQQLQQWIETDIVYDIARPENFYIEGWLVLKPWEVARGEDINIRYRAWLEAGNL
jgi:hypothetical protein